MTGTQWVGVILLSCLIAEAIRQALAAFIQAKRRAPDVDL